MTMPSMTTTTDADVTTYYSNNKNSSTCLTPLISGMLMMFGLNNNVVNRPIQNLKRSCQRP